MKARDLGVPFDGACGKFNAITDVAGVLVGHETIIEGEGAWVPGKGPIRTGVTMVMPRGTTLDPCMAGWFTLNGNGEMTGTTWIEESGYLDGPIGITNTLSVGTMHQAIIEWQLENLSPTAETAWALPVSAETYDGVLNDIVGLHVKPHHVFAAFESAKSGDVPKATLGAAPA